MFWNHLYHMILLTIDNLYFQAKEKLGINETADIEDITSNTTVVITINDKDDNIPVFGQISYNAYVNENVIDVPLTIIGTKINVTDKDQVYSD